MTKPIMIRASEKEKQIWEEFVAQCRVEGLIAKTTMIKILHRVMKEGKIRKYAGEEI